MDFEQCKRAYRCDPNFYQIIKSLQRIIKEMNLSPSEVRDAAMFAVYLHELENPAPIPIFPAKENV